MSKIQSLAKLCEESFVHLAVSVAYTPELTLLVPAQHIVEVCNVLKNKAEFSFEMLMDLCGVDYLHYGIDEWKTNSATTVGFERGVHELSMMEFPETKEINRYAVIYHLLSLTHNHRIRLKTFVPFNTMLIDSVISVWNCADWYEREAFDLYGILFRNHPDLRRILTDYGFIGHPFRKDFPVWGKVEVRFDAKLNRVIYEPVDIVPRILVPKVIRNDQLELQEDETHD